MEPTIIIPTLDPSAKLEELVDGLSAVGFSCFIIVDDGSALACSPIFDALEDKGCAVLHHPENRGKGAAIKTALDYAAKNHAASPGFITVDGDGQHLPEDVAAVAAASRERPGDIILGTRELHTSAVPLRSRLGNGFSSLFFKLDTGHSCADTQTGLRFVPRCQVPFARFVEGDRYDYEMNFLTKAVKQGLPVSTVSIQTVYDPEAAPSHFQTVKDSYRIYRSFIRFTAASLSCSLVDLGVFTILTLALDVEVASMVVIATVTARIASGGLNFLLNKRFSFGARGGGTAQAVRYATLFLLQMFMSMMLVTMLAFLPLPLTVIKIFVDSALFVVSYFVQRNWVFAKHRSDARAPERIPYDPEARDLIHAGSQTAVELGFAVRSGAGGLYGVRAPRYLRDTEGASRSHDADDRRS